jgi:hypothetical protein
VIRLCVDDASHRCGQYTSDGHVPRSIVGGDERATCDEPDAQDVEERGRDCLRGNPLCAAADARERWACARDRCHGRECVRLLAPVQEIQGRDMVPGVVRRRLPQLHEAFGGWKRERPKVHGVNHSEHGDRRSDSEGEHVTASAVKPGALASRRPPCRMSRHTVMLPGRGDRDDVSEVSRSCGFSLSLGGVHVPRRRLTGHRTVDTAQQVACWMASARFDVDFGRSQGSGGCARTL